MSFSYVVCSRCQFYLVISPFSVVEVFMTIESKYLWFIQPVRMLLFVYRLSHNMSYDYHKTL